MRQAAFVFSLFCAEVVRAAAPALMPMPAKMELAEGALPIDASFGVAPGTDSRLAPAAKRFLACVARQTGIVLAPSGWAATLAIVCAPCTASLVLGEDESYQLDVKQKHGVSLKEAQEIFDQVYLVDQKNDDPEQFRAIGWCRGRPCSVIFEIRHDAEGECHHLVTPWKATPARAAQLNISRQAVVKTLLARALSETREERPRRTKAG